MSSVKLKRRISQPESWTLLKEWLGRRRAPGVGELRQLDDLDGAVAEEIEGVNGDDTPNDHHVLVSLQHVALELLLLAAL